MKVKRSNELKQQFMYDFTFNIIYDTLQYVGIIRIGVHHIHSLVFANSYTIYTHIDIKAT